MAENKLEPKSLGAVAASARVVRPSIGNALPYFVSVVVFPLVIIASLQGGWWIAAPYLFLLIPDFCDAMFGLEKRNMDPRKTRESDLFLYKLSLWLWAALWPATLVFALWQLLVSNHLSTLETVFMVFVLSVVAQASFITGHELIHRRSVIERRIGEFILASVSYPHYASEHVYVHHALACTPGDPGSAPKGVSFWGYLPQEIKSNLLGAWRFERDRLARRQLPVWHYTNPFWRYVLETAAWYALAYWLGGIWTVVIYAALCCSVVLSMKIINYVQHCGADQTPHMMFLYDGEGVDHLQTLCRNFDHAVCALTSDILLFAPISAGPERQVTRELAELCDQEPAESAEKLGRARCIFTSGDSGIGNRFEEAQREILARGADG